MLDKISRSKYKLMEFEFMTSYLHFIISFIQDAGSPTLNA